MSNIAPESSKANPQHKNLNKYLKNRNLIDKAKDSLYNYFNKKGEYNEDFEYIEEKERKNNKEDSRLVSERTGRNSGSDGTLGDGTVKNGRKINKTHSRIIIFLSWIRYHLASLQTKSYSKTTSQQEQ